MTMCLVADGLVAEGDVPREEHLREVPQAQFVAQPPDDHEQDEVGRVLNVVEGRADPVVADASAALAAEGAVASAMRRRCSTVPVAAQRGQGTDSAFRWRPRPLRYQNAALYRPGV